MEERRGRGRSQNQERPRGRDRGYYREERRGRSHCGDQGRCRGRNRDYELGRGQGQDRGRGREQQRCRGYNRDNGLGRNQGQDQERGRGHDREQGQGHCGDQGRGGGRGLGHERSLVLWQRNVEGPSGLGKGYCGEGFHQHEINAKKALQELEKTLGTEGKDLQTAFNDWCAQHADQQFPGLRYKAYAIPPFFFKCYPVKMTPCGCSELKPCPGNFFMITAQESDQKGDNAQRKVGRAFRLLNEDLERKGETTLFIMTGVVRDNILAWVKRPENSSEMKKLFPIVPAERPEGAPVFEEKQKRMETDLMVVHQKGVTFVQVKGCGANTESQDGAVIKREVAAAVGQLAKDEAMFRHLMEGSNFRDKCQVQKVVAIPALTCQQLTGFEVKSEQIAGCVKDVDVNDDAVDVVDVFQDVVFLCQDHLFLDDIEKSESETDLTHFRQWWSQLIEQAAEVPPKCSGEIIGKYAGLLSTPVSQKDGGFHHLVRSLKDAIRLTARAYRRQMLTNKDKEWVHTERKGKLVCLSGHEMCGVRQLLLYKARHFTHTHQSSCVVVVYHVWFMAEPEQLPRDLKTSPEFCEHRLDVVLCCPPAVQHLLHHVRGGDGVSQPQYTRDTRHMEAPTNGPIPLCIRHGQHGGRIVDCAQCGRQMAQFFKENVRGCDRTYAEMVKVPKGQGTSLSSSLSLSVAIVVHCRGEEQQARAGQCRKQCEMKPEETKLLQEIKKMAPGGLQIVCTSSLSECALDVAIFVPHEVAETQPEASTENSSLPPISSLYWTRNDLARYSERDRSAIRQVGFRCRSQLILIWLIEVPWNGEHNTVYNKVEVHN
ncbi:hypothetical protein C0Q70_17356 [Pomacea canaliculata]|uniref:Uncharacterized protein n=1 Tax=Pomacea canaliculata TaxID=400727 RepID=A0A2T7NK69_POMCA|nr:hypothetical protein C0Q70_17356 [Pomacea canaliculata]